MLVDSTSVSSMVEVSDSSEFASISVCPVAKSTNSASTLITPAGLASSGI